LISDGYILDASKKQT